MSKASHINVVVRVRPLSQSEIQGCGHNNMAWRLGAKAVTQLDVTTWAPIPSQTYAFDRVFGPSCDTSDVYKATTEEVVEDVLNGFNGTVFAYGQTSSGKTHTMRGSEQQPGIISLAIRQIFERIRQSSDKEFLLRVSYLEIYNEKVRDLLSTDDRSLQVRQDPKRGAYVAELSEEVVVSEDQVEALVEEGDRKRTVGTTAMNHCSSRSHAIFRMVVESRSSGARGDATVRIGTINLVDLAGSERLKSTKAEGTRAVEGAMINKSLLTLGTVIRKLSTSSGGAIDHVPYRDSTLTRILQPALGGNSKTSVICAVSPAEMNMEETLSTLKFASQAKMVTNVVTVNEVQDDAALIRRYKQQIEEMAEDLRQLRGGANVRDLEARLAQKEDEISRLRSLIVSSKTLVTANNQVIRRETWCAGLNGELSALSTSIMVGGGKTADFASHGAVAVDRVDEDMMNLLLADSENAVTPAKKVPSQSSSKKHSEQQQQRQKQETELQQQQIKLLEEEVSKLRKQLDQVQGDLEDARELQEALEEDNKKLDAQIKSSSGRAESTDVELHEARKRIAWLVETLQMTEDQMVDMRRESELAKAKEAQWETRRKELEEERDAATRKIADLSKLEQTALRVEELELEVKALQWEKEQFTQGRAQEDEQREEQWKSKMEAFAATMREEAAHNEALVSEQAEIIKKLEEKVSAMEELELELEEAELAKERGEESASRTAAELQARVQLLEAKVASGIETVKERDGELARVTQERDELRERLRISDLTLQQEEATTATQIAGLQSQIRSVASVREKIKMLSGSGSIAVPAAAEGAATMSDEDLKTRMEKLVHENASLKQALADATARVEKLKDVETELENRRLSHATHKISTVNWEARVKELEKQLDEAQFQAATTAEKARKRICALEQEISQMEEEVDQLEKSNAKLRNECKVQADAMDSAALVDQLQAQLKAREAELEAARIKVDQQLAQLRQAHQSELRVREEELKAAGKKATSQVEAQLRDELLREKAASSAARSEARQREEEVERAKKNAAAAKDRTVMLEKEVKALRAEVESAAKSKDREQQDAKEREQRATILRDLEAARVALETKEREIQEMRDVHAQELLKKDKKLAQLKEMALEKAKEKLKERDAVILRLKKEKARIAQERDEDMEGLIRQHQAETEELNKQLKAKSEALSSMRALVAELERADSENAVAAAGASDVNAAAAKQKQRKDMLLKLHQNFN